MAKSGQSKGRPQGLLRPASYQFATRALKVSFHILKPRLVGPLRAGSGHTIGRASACKGQILQAALPQVRFEHKGTFGFE